MEVDIGNLADEAVRFEDTALGEYLAARHRKKKEDIASSLVNAALNSTDARVRFIAEQLTAADTWDEVQTIKAGESVIPTRAEPETVVRAFEPYYTPPV